MTPAILLQILSILIGCGLLTIAIARLHWDYRGHRLKLPSTTAKQEKPGEEETPPEQAA